MRLWSAASSYGFTTEPVAISRDLSTMLSHAELPTLTDMRRSAVRSVILAIAAIWFLIQAFARIEGDATHEVVALGQRIAFGLVLVALALIDWKQFRWWWLVVGVLALVIVWIATGHPLLFLFGFV